MSGAPPHEDAVETFVDQVATAEMPAVQRLVLFGTVARASHTADSDVDVLAVLDTDADVRAVEDRLRDLAYDVMLEYGVVFSIHAVTESSYEDRSGHPFFQNVAAEGRAIYG